MDSLETKLKNFDPTSEDFRKEENEKNKKTPNVNHPFYGLAEAFLYGGYVAVRDCDGKERYRIYLRTVEFYCHCEDNRSSLPKDLIVYHRNGRFLEYINGEQGEATEDREKRGEVPYFPLMAFHAHASGIDITFENKKLQLRSSALIRAYEVYDVQRDIFLTYDTKSRKFVECKEEKKRVNTQSTYLYYFLNGFIGDSVKWEDRDSEWKGVKNIKVAPRKNVFEYDEKGDIKKDINGKKVKDERAWSYTRSEDLTPEDLEPKKSV